METSGSLWQFYRDEPALNKAGDIVDFPGNSNDSISLTLKMPLINCEISLPLKCSTCWSLVLWQVKSQYLKISLCYKTL